MWTLGYSPQCSTPWPRTGRTRRRFHPVFHPVRSRQNCSRMGRCCYHPRCRRMSDLLHREFGPTGEPECSEPAAARLQHEEMRGGIDDVVDRGVGLCWHARLACWMFCVVRTVRNRGDRRGERGSDQVAAHHHDQHLSGCTHNGGYKSLPLASAATRRTMAKAAVRGWKRTPGRQSVRVRAATG